MESNSKFLWVLGAQASIAFSSKAVELLHSAVIFHGIFCSKGAHFPGIGINRAL